MKSLYRIISLTCIILGALLIQSCESIWIDESSTNPSPLPSRSVHEETRHCMILFSSGFNSLGSYLKEDIEDLQTGYLPTKSRNDDLVMIISRLPVAARDYSVNTAPVIIRLYKDYEGNAVMDTVKTFSTSAMLSDPAVLREALDFIQTNYPAKDYGMVASSHATGWLPGNYYSAAIPKSANASVPASLARHEYIEPVVDEKHPLTKSFGMDVQILGGRQYGYEMEVSEFSNSIPMHLKYLIFDACLMGGIEIAYQLKNKADIIGFSQTEVLAEGLDYTTLLSHLLEGKEPDIISVAKDYMSIYENSQGVMNSATYSVVDTHNLEELADACSVLFEKYRHEISSLNPYKVQQFYRGDRHWFYDMEDIIRKAGATDEEMADFDKAMKKIILYKGHTPSFMEEFDINTFCGFSMFLPCHATPYLVGIYRYTDWCKRTRFAI